MARPQKEGLDYFPFDVNFFLNGKIKKLNAKHGTNGLLAFIQLLCHIYRQGYFCNWDNEDELLFAKYDLFITQEELNSIVNTALNLRLLDSRLYAKFKILTSKSIQDRYFAATQKRKEHHLVDEYILDNYCRYGISTSISSENTQTKDENITQSKLNQRIPNENERENDYKKLTQFFNTELSKIEDSDSNVAILYKEIVAFIHGNKALSTPLTGLLRFDNLLRFDEFSELFKSVCSNQHLFKSALLKIHDNPQYQQGKSLFLRLKTWFENEKNPENLKPQVKRKKVYDNQ